MGPARTSLVTAMIVNPSMEAEMLLARMLGISPREENPATGFADDEAIPTWARTTVAALEEVGLVHRIPGRHVPSG
jgi:hypothetical protein